MKKILSLFLVFVLILSGPFLTYGESKAAGSLDITQLAHDAMWDGTYFKSSKAYYVRQEYPIVNKKNVNSPLVRSIKFNKDTYKLGDKIEATIEVDSKYPLEKFSMVYELPSGKGFVPMLFKKVSRNKFVCRGTVSRDWEVGNYFILKDYKKENFFITGYDTKKNPVLVKNNKFPSFSVIDPSGKKKELESIKNKKTEVLVSKGANARDSDGKIFMYFSPGEVFPGYELKDHYYTFVSGVGVRLDKKFVEKSKKITFISKGVKGRYPSGKVAKYYPIGDKVIGHDIGDYIKTTYKNKDVYVYKGFVERDGIGRSYISKGVNVRDNKGRKIGYLKKGQRIGGRRRGALIEINFKGKKATVHSKYLY